MLLRRQTPCLAYAAFPGRARTAAVEQRGNFGVRVYLDEIGAELRAVDPDVRQERGERSGRRTRHHWSSQPPSASPIMASSARTSKLFAQIAVHDKGQRGELHDGSKSICSRLCSSAFCKPRSHASASGDDRASVRHDEGSQGSDTLPHQNALKSSGRDGLSVLAYDLTRVMNIVGTKTLITAITG
jgi:hypothetical protein